MKAVKIGSYVLPWVLSVIFLFSFITKLIEISDLPFYIKFYLSLFHIDIKDGIVNFIGYVLLSIELTLGIAWSQKCMRLSAMLLTIPLLIMFCAVTFIGYVNGGIDNCGCFGSLLRLNDISTVVKNIIILCLVLGFYYTNRFGEYNEISFRSFKRMGLILLYSVVLVLPFYIFGFLWYNPHKNLIEEYAHNQVERINENPSTIVVYHYGGNQHDISEFKDCLTHISGDYLPYMLITNLGSKGIQRLSSVDMRIVNVDKSVFNELSPSLSLIVARNNNYEIFNYRILRFISNYGIWSYASRFLLVCKIVQILLLLSIIGVIIANAETPKTVFVYNSKLTE